MKIQVPEGVDPEAFAQTVRENLTEKTVLRAAEGVIEIIKTLPLEEQDAAAEAFQKALFDPYFNPEDE